MPPASVVLEHKFLRRYHHVHAPLVDLYGISGIDVGEDRRQLTPQIDLHPRRVSQCALSTTATATGKCTRVNYGVPLMAFSTTPPYPLARSYCHVTGSQVAILRWMPFSGDFWTLEREPVCISDSLSGAVWASSTAGRCATIHTCVPLVALLATPPRLLRCTYCRLLGLRVAVLRWMPFGGDFWTLEREPVCISNNFACTRWATSTLRCTAGNSGFPFVPVLTTPPHFSVALRRYALGG